MAQSVARHHAEWLSLVEVSGPFLTLPVLQRAFPQGLEDTDPELAATLRRAYEEWQADPTLHGQWVRWVLGTLLGFVPQVLVDGPAVPAALAWQVPEHGETLRPSLAVLDPVGNGERRARLLVTVWPDEQKLNDPLPEARWAASPLDRMVELLRGTGVRLGLVTNGERWTLVDAPRGATAGFATWEAGIWQEERSALNAFRSLLGAGRFFSVAEADTLAALLAESANAQQEVTDQLGRQVRAAVEMLVDAFSRADRERGGELLLGVSPAELYQGSVTVMMRLVFLLAAEERGLFLLGEQLYDESYAVSTLLGQLQEKVGEFGEEPLEKRSSAWQRLLATFRMVHGGVQHERLRLPAYGGGLFDPERYPFLEGRRVSGAAGPPATEAVSIDDRTVLHLLDALQILRRQGRGAGPVEAQRLSYRALDVEQIGHVYEGLLDHTAVRVSDPAVGLVGKHEPEISLREVEAHARRGREPLLAWLAELTGESERFVARRLDAQVEQHERSRLLFACDNDMDLADRVEPFLGLLRRDLRGDPVVYLPDSIYVTKAAERRASGTYYTPRALAEEVVRHTLDPLAYRPGPAEGAEPAEWKLRPATELLSLKVCDMAMGSGAFLVAACRYLADRLVEAWSAEGTEHMGTNGERIALPADPEERAALARRLIADRCLYGVDKNPMAVEMAKLSVWLVTLAKDRPFTFLDHTLRPGDSLLGITSIDQLVNLHPDPARGRELHHVLTGDVTEVIRQAVDHAAQARRRLEAFPVLDVRDAAEKERLLREATRATEALSVVADALVGAALHSAGLPADVLDGRLLDLAPQVQAALDPHRSPDDRAVALTDLQLQALEWLQAGKPPLEPDRHPFHWPLEFPEVFAAGHGLDATVGNPPFQGGKKITGALGTDYREWLVMWLADGRRGHADLVTYFFLRAGCLLRSVGGMGLLATNTISQGDTREVGLDHLAATGWTITRGVKSRPWPGDANLEISQVWLHHGDWSGKAVLDGALVSAIAPELEPRSRVTGTPRRLQAAAGTAFIGSYLVGSGFLLTPAEAQALIHRDPRNADVLFPYLIGDELNNQPDQSPERWAINFFDWPLEKAETYRDCMAIVREKVMPFREGRNRERHRKYWWQYGEVRPGLYRGIEGLDRILAISRVSKAVMPAFVPTGVVFSDRLVVFTYDDDAHFGLLSSAFHWWWAVTWASTLETRTNYTPSDCFETFSQPDLTDEVTRAGKALDDYRRATMLERQEGLTKTYNRVHDPREHSEDIAELRRLHVVLDHAVAVAYGWEDLPLDHDFHETRQGVRYTLGLRTRTEVLDRLLELNHEQAAAEAALAPQRPRRGGGRRATPGSGQAALELP
jgi:Eco57I restriction-modification methylase/MmeI, target recognition domain